jgi:hypothetical protein
MKKLQQKAQVKAQQKAQVKTQNVLTGTNKVTVQHAAHQLAGQYYDALTKISDPAERQQAYAALGYKQALVDEFARTNGKPPVSLFPTSSDPSSSHPHPVDVAAGLPNGVITRKAAQQRRQQLKKKAIKKEMKEALSLHPGHTSARATPQKALLTTKTAQRKVPKHNVLRPTATVSSVHRKNTLSMHPIPIPAVVKRKLERVGSNAVSAYRKIKYEKKVEKKAEKSLKTDETQYKDVQLRDAAKRKVDHWIDQGKRKAMKAVGIPAKTHRPTLAEVNQKRKKELAKDAAACRRDCLNLSRYQKKEAQAENNEPSTFVQETAVGPVGAECDCRAFTDEDKSSAVPHQDAAAQEKARQFYNVLMSIHDITERQRAFNALGSGKADVNQFVQEQGVAPIFPASPRAAGTVPETAVVEQPGVSFLEFLSDDEEEEMSMVEVEDAQMTYGNAVEQIKNCKRLGKYFAHHLEMLKAAESRGTVNPLDLRKYSARINRAESGLKKCHRLINMGLN